MGATFHRDSAGVAQYLKTDAELAARISAEARAVAVFVRAVTGADVAVDQYVTDRVAASVTIRDPAGRLMQVRDGALTRGAAARGLEVRER